MTDRLTPETFEMTVGGSGGCWVLLGNSQVKWVLHRAMFEDPKQMVLRVCGPFVASVKEFAAIVAETPGFEAFSSAAQLDNDFAHNVVADHSCLWRTIPIIAAQKCFAHLRRLMPARELQCVLLFHYILANFDRCPTQGIDGEFSLPMARALTNFLTCFKTFALETALDHLRMETSLDQLGSDSDLPDRSPADSDQTGAQVKRKSSLVPDYLIRNRERAQARMNTSKRRAVERPTRDQKIWRLT